MSVMALAGAGIAAAAAPPSTPDAKSAAADGPDADRFFDAIVKVNARAVPNARSAATLGPEREGTGIVIGENGLILTIGYLIVEADDVEVVDRGGRTLAARVVGYDHATGFGLVRAVVPLDVPPIPLGDSGKLAERDPVMIVNYSGEGDVTLAYVVSKRPFTGSWEYLLDTAIFTSPPTANWSGAALVGRDLKLVGVGSLIVREATSGEDSLPGNMFVPIDTLKPILADLVKNGHRAGPSRPWLGVAADEVQGRLVVARVSPDGPGDKAGLQPATSSSASAATACARRPISIARSGAAAAPAPTSRCACCRGSTCARSPCTRSTASSTSAPARRTEAAPSSRPDARPNP